jgi:uncharacterized SAM-binding protein YcdF (DUF218 family)
MAGGGKSGGDSYWPGFVDALTNVVIAMIFVVVVLAISLSFAAQMMGRKLAQQIIEQQAQQAPAAASAATAVARADPSPPEPAVPDAPTPSAPPTATAPLPRITRIAVAAPATPAPAAVAVTGATSRLQLDYEKTALDLDDRARAALKDALSGLGPLQERRVSLVAVGPDPTLSDNQRAAFVRLMAVRNVLIEQGFDAGRIEVRVDTTQAAPVSSVIVNLP